MPQYSVFLNIYHSLAANKTILSSACLKGDGYLFEVPVVMTHQLTSFLDKFANEHAQNSSRLRLFHLSRTILDFPFAFFQLALRMFEQQAAPKMWTN